MMWCTWQSRMSRKSGRYRRADRPRIHSPLGKRKTTSAPLRSCGTSSIHCESPTSNTYRAGGDCRRRRARPRVPASLRATRCAARAAHPASRPRQRPSDVQRPRRGLHAPDSPRCMSARGVDTRHIAHRAFARSRLPAQSWRRRTPTSSRSVRRNSEVAGRHGRVVPDQCMTAGSATRGHLGDAPGKLLRIRAGRRLAVVVDERHTRRRRARCSASSAIVRRASALGRIDVVRIHQRDELAARERHAAIQRGVRARVGLPDQRHRRTARGGAQLDDQRSAFVGRTVVDGDQLARQPSLVRERSQRLRKEARMVVTRASRSIRVASACRSRCASQPKRSTRKAPVANASCVFALDVGEARAAPAAAATPGRARSARLRR